MKIKYVDKVNIKKISFFHTTSEVENSAHFTKQQCSESEFVAQATNFNSLSAAAHSGEIRACHIAKIIFSMPAIIKIYASDREFSKD